MRSTKSLWLAEISATLLIFLIAPNVCQAKNPKYGGTLRVEIRANSISLDPRDWQPGNFSTAENEKLAALVYDRLVSLDDYGRFQPQLATEWSHDATARSWQFKFRNAVTLSDGSPLSSADVVASLQPLLPSGTQFSPGDSSLTIHLPRPTPDLLEQLASGRFFIYHAQPDHIILGTGAFYVAESTTASPTDASSILKPARIKFRAREDAWSGRPFLDAIEVTLGQPALRQIIDLQVGKADLIDLAPDLVRKARQENLRVWSSSLNTLFALRFDPAQPLAADPRLREALDLALDRETMAHVLLQRQADPASALLPQWLSGYASLFQSVADPPRAREILAQLSREQSPVRDPLRLKVDGAGDLLKLLAERVAVNARQANLSIQLAPRALENSVAKSPEKDAAALHIFVWHYDSLSPRAELEELVKHLNWQETQDALKGRNDSEQLYDREKSILDSRIVLPLLLLPDSVALAPNVRNWSPARWGDWRLADVWLESPESLPSNAINPANSSAPVPAGARP